MKLLLYNFNWEIHICAFMYYLLMITSIPTRMNIKQIRIKIIQLVKVLGYFGRGPGFKFHLTQLVGYHSYLQ